MKRKIKLLALISLALAVLLAFASCAARDNAVGGSGAPEYDSSNGSDYTGGGYYPEKGDGTVGDASTVVTDRKIIKTVNESIQTDAYDDFMTSLHAAITEAGGFISSKQENGENYFNSSSLRYANLTLRIPSDKLDAFTKRVDSLAVVTSYSESQNDVTGSYVDIQSRISVLEAEETALLDMLSKSTTVDTSLKIRDRLLTVQADLASLRAQLANIDDRATYSTVYLNVREVRRAVENNPSFFKEVGGNFSDNLYSIGEFFRSFAVWLLGDSLIIILTLGILVGAFFLLRFLYGKYKAKRAAKFAPTPKAPEPPKAETAENTTEETNPTPDNE